MIGGGATSSGVNAQSPDIALKASAVYGCADLIAATIASLPAAEYKTEGASRVKIESPLTYLLEENPNIDLTAYNLWYAVMSNLLLRGEAFIYPIVSNKEVKALELLRFGEVNVLERVNGDIYYQVMRQGRPMFEVGPNKIIHLKGFTFDGTRGVSPLRYAAEMIGTSIVADSHMGASVKNAPKPPGILSLTTKIGDKDRLAQLRDQFHDQLSGLNNGKPALLTEGAEYKPISTSNLDLDLVQMSKFTVEQICRVYRVPPSLIGHTMPGQTGTTAEQDYLKFVKQCIVPWLTNLEQEVTRKITPLNYVKFDTNLLLRGDTQARTMRQVSLFNIGALNQNEVRAEEGLAPIAGGDEYMKPLNLSPIGDTANGTMNRKPQDNEPRN
jgi:HK97 family phage portal protein